ncbi:hypothetical protein [Bacterioplanoides pacificum]|uniref:Lipoprotein n=1 Tax=Bacterioplanoides pacificum TaxID=1171596 RepID=A0ABV7VYZ0_9GAMM
MNFAKAFLPLAFYSLMLTGCGGSSGSCGQYSLSSQAKQQLR